MRSEEAALRRTQAERRSIAEEALLEAAAELIAEEGVDRASLRRIGARAGISRAMPSYHFGSKDALVTQLAERSDERTRAAAGAPPQSEVGSPDFSTLDILCKTVETYLSLFDEATAEERAVIVLWGATFPTKSSVPAMIEADRVEHVRLVETIRAGQKDETIRSDVDPEAAAVVLIGMIRGIAALTLTHPGIADPVRVRSMCRSWIESQLTPRGGTI